MRVSKQEMAANRARILEEASRLFRERGIENTSVADVMNAAGLTHGGFYRHFQSKDDLVNASLECAFNNFGEEMQRAVAERGAKQTVIEFIEHYLSQAHADNPGQGCPIAALAIETARRPEVFQDTMMRGTGQVIALLSGVMKGAEEEKNIRATALLNLLVGSLIMSRTATDKRQREAILEAGLKMARRFLE